MSHTPGPWFSVSTHDRPNIMTDGGFLIAETRGINCEANARLIAAAPDLLAALEEIEYLDQPLVRGQPRRVTICEIARAAIAKATGEAP